MIHLCTIAYANTPWLDKFIETAMQQPEVRELYLHDCSPFDEVHLRCESAAANWERIHWIKYGNNRGCSACWNDSIVRADKEGLLPLIANDDVWFSPGDIGKLAKKAQENQDAFFITCAGYHTGFGQWVGSHGYSCFILNPIGYRTIGAFDNNIFPAYLEDCDYSYRAKLLGMHEENTSETMVYHVGSAAIKSSNSLALSNGMTHQQNFQYYHKKWGGSNGEEVYVCPFNDKEAPIKIEFEQRHSPFGEGRDRNAQDQRVYLSVV